MHRKGFTLIEVIIVIGILGILAAIILGTFNNSRMKARDTAIRNSIGQLRWQAELVYDLQGANYLHWSEHSVIQDDLEILLKDINSNHQLPDGAPYVTVISDEQRKNYCISAPLRSVDNMYVCIDATGQVQDVSNPCPDVDEEEDPLRCSDLL